MIPIEKLEAFVRRQAEIERLMCEPEVLADHLRLQELNRERSRLAPVIEAFVEWQSVGRQIAEDREALDDPELGPLAQEELPELEARRDELERQVQVLLLPADPNDEKNTLLEIRAGTGGEEAALFAADLFRMYARFAESRRWQVEVMSSSEAAAGGLKEIIALVSGDRASQGLQQPTGAPGQARRSCADPHATGTTLAHGSRLSAGLLPRSHRASC